MVKEVQANITVAQLPVHHKSHEDTAALDAFLDDFKTVLMRNHGLFTDTQYKICDAVFGATFPNCTPYKILEYINAKQATYIGK
jgi:hypothetical protein